MDVVAVVLLVIGVIVAACTLVAGGLFLMMLFGDELEQGMDYLEKLADRVRGRERS